MPPRVTDKKKACIEPGCGKEFEPASNRHLRCQECQKKHGAEMQREYRKKHNDKKRRQEDEKREKQFNQLAEMRAKELQAAAIERQEAQAKAMPAARTLVDLHMVIRDGNDGIAAAKMLANCVPTPFNNILSNQERPIVIHLLVKEEFGESYPPPIVFPVRNPE